MSQQTYAEQVREQGEKLRANGEEERAQLVLRAAKKLSEAQRLDEQAHAQMKDQQAGQSIFAKLFRVFQLSAEAKSAMAKNIRKDADELLKQAGI